MSKKKIDRALYGPSWTEVIFGAVLSFGLGVLLAIVFLVLKPINVVKELPKEPNRDMAYLVLGNKDSNKSRGVDAKLKDLAGGKSVTLSEDELNAYFASKAPAPAPAPPAPKAPAKPADKSAAKPGVKPPPPPVTTISSPNFRIVDQQLQVAIPTSLDLLGLSQPLVVVATGTFSNTDGKVSFDPTDFQVGSLPANRIPYVKGAVIGKILGGQTFPEELTAIWGKLKDVTIEGNALKLTMP